MGRHRFTDSRLTVKTGLGLHYKSQPPLVSYPRAANVRVLAAIQNSAPSSIVPRPTTSRGDEHTISQSALTARRPTGIPLLTHTFPVLSATVTTSNGMTSDCQRFIRTDRVSHLYPLRVRHAGKNPRIAISRRHLVWSPHERVKQVFR